MSAALLQEELQIRAELERAGLQPPVATLAVVMVTREHARPRGELPDIVRQYQTLEDRTAAAQAVEELLANGWLIERETDGHMIIVQASDLSRKIAEKLRDLKISQRLLDLRSAFRPSVRVVGAMNEEVVYTEYMRLLATAQSEICLPMLVTTPMLKSVAILQERAKAGVHVRILLGSPMVVAALRGETMSAIAHERIAGWKKHAEGIPRMRVRIAHSVDDMLIATCMTIDGKILRFDVYDPNQQRSLQGVMIEVQSPMLQLNLVRLFQRHFDDAWRRAEPAKPWGKLWFLFTLNWQWSAFVAFAVLTYVAIQFNWGGGTWSNILGSSAATFLVTALVTSWGGALEVFIQAAMIDPFCGGCSPGSVAGECRDSWKRHGIVKAHWECWADCNLACAFCYRMRGKPLDTQQAKTLIRAVITGGAKSIVFAGGDPSIRPDLPELIQEANELGLKVEIQTNGHHLGRPFLAALESVHLVGLSLDGPDAATHDDFRSKPDNFARVIRLLESLEGKNVSTVVRTLVAKPNSSEIIRMVPILQRYRNIVRWSLVEFTPVADGFVNRSSYEIDRAVFDKIAESVLSSYKGSAEIDVYHTERKVGAYLLITPDGRVYGTGGMTEGAVYPTIGSILSDHLNVLAAKLPFSKENHVERYGPLLNL